MMKTLWNRIPRAVRFALITAVSTGYAGILTNLVDRSAKDFNVNAEEVQITDVTVELPQVEEEAPEPIGQNYPRYWLNTDIDMLAEDEVLSPALRTLAKREMVYVTGSGEEYASIMDTEGVSGYVRSAALSGSLEEIFDAADMHKWLSMDTVLKSAPSDGAADAASGVYNTEIVITGTNDYKYWQAVYNDTVVYVDHDALMDEMYVEPEPEPEPVKEYSGPMSNPNWDGTVLNAWRGTIIGPSGKETYYNLPMGGVISLMQSAGYSYNYWVREDGVKMYGDYVMAACSFDIRPRGSIVETSLGTAICADTGTFAYTNPTQVDIAVDW